MGLLHVSLFGCIRVAHDEASMEIKMTHSIQALLAYLILFRHRTHPREVLAEIFWGDKNQERSRSSLNTALWHLRNAVEPCGVTRGTYLVSDHPDEIGFNQDSPFWLDVQAFEEGISQATHSLPADIREGYLPNLEYAITLYRGDLLEGFYDDWVLREREHFRARYLSTLIYLMDIYRNRRDFERSLSCGQKILEMDPLREEIHRYLMQLYLETGQRARAARQFEICREALARELHIEPMLETQELYEQLVSHKPNLSLQIRVESFGELQQTLSQLRQARTAFEQARDQLNDSIKVVESAIKNQQKQG